MVECDDHILPVLIQRHKDSPPPPSDDKLLEDDWVVVDKGFTLDGPDVKLNNSKYILEASDVADLQRVEKIATLQTEDNNDILYDGKNLLLKEDRVKALAKMLPQSLLPANNSLGEGLPQLPIVNNGGSNYMQIDTAKIPPSSFLHTLVKSVGAKFNWIPGNNFIAPCGVGGFVCGFITGLLDETVLSKLQKQHPKAVDRIRKALIGISIALSVGVIIVGIFSGYGIVAIITALAASWAFSIAGFAVGKWFAKLLRKGFQLWKDFFNEPQVQVQKQEQTDPETEKQTHAQPQEQGHNIVLLPGQDTTQTPAQATAPVTTQATAHATTPSATQAVQETAQLPTQASQVSAPATTHVAQAIAQGTTTLPTELENEPEIHNCSGPHETDGFLNVGKCNSCRLLIASVGFVHKDEPIAHMAFCHKCARSKLKSWNKNCPCGKPCSSYFGFGQKTPCCEPSQNCFKVGYCSKCEDDDEIKYTKTVWRTTVAAEAQAIALGKKLELELRFCKKHFPQSIDGRRYGEIKTMAVE